MKIKTISSLIRVVDKPPSSQVMRFTLRTVWFECTILGLIHERITPVA